MSNETAPPGSGGSGHLVDVRREVEEVLASSKAVSLIEGKVIEFALERKIGAVLQDYARTRLMPTLIGGVMAATLVLGFVGFTAYNLKDAKGYLDEARATVEAAKRELATLDSQRNSLRTEIAEIRRLLSADVAALKSEIRVATSDTQQASRDLLGDMRQNGAQLAAFRESTKKVVDQATAAVEKADGASTAASTAETKVESVQSQIKKAEAAAIELNKNLGTQWRIINSGIMDVIYLNDKEISPTVDLPSEDGGVYRATFTVLNISKDAAEFKIDVGGDEVKPIVPRRQTKDQQWQWRPIPGTNRMYEYKVDHVFHAGGGKIPDFMVLRIKADKSLLERLMRGNR